MKPIFLTILILVPYCSFSQVKYPDKKIDSRYFESNESIDTCEIYYAFDLGKLDFKYTDTYLGAIDKNFNLNLTRHIRIKINKLSALSDNKLTICNLGLDISQEELNFGKVKAYTYSNGKVSKSKLTTKLLSFEYKDGVLTLDLEKTSINQNTILDIKFSISHLDKKHQTWKFCQFYPVLKSILEINTPEVYYYDKKLYNPNSIETTTDSKKQTGVLLGYNVPEVELERKLVTTTYYKYLKEKGYNKNADKVYCSYSEQYYEVNNLYPDYKQCLQLVFDQVSVDPIIF